MKNPKKIPSLPKDGTPLSLGDLQVPVRPLLTRDEEWRAGRRVRSCLARLAKLLPRHPEGYRRFLLRMSEVTNGAGPMFAWISFRERMLDDLDRAQSLFDRAGRLIDRRPKLANEVYEEGLSILETYPLDPETLYTWTKEVVTSPRRTQEASFFRRKRFQQIDRLLGRTLEILERERDSLILPNFRLVLKDVFRYHPLGMRHSDLFQEGVLGLQKAVFRYDPARGTRFSTYATYWIRQSIRKALIDKSRMIRVPQAVQEELRKDEPSIAENEANRVRRILGDTMLFSFAESDDDDRNSFTVPDGGNSSLDEALHTDVIPDAVSEALEGLDSRSREVIVRRFGLAGDPPQTLEDIGKRLSLSRERIRQIEREALRRMERVPNLQEVYENLGAQQAAGTN